MPQISFVVTCYNFAPFIGECLGGILSQTGASDYEVILVDDASTDASDVIIHSFHDPRIRYIRHSDNQGSVSTISEGLSLARGEYVARIDGDDRYRPYFLERALPILERHPEVGMVYGDVAGINAAGDQIQDPWEGVPSRAVHGGQDFQGDEYLALVLENAVPAATTLVRRSALAEALPLPAHLHFADWYLNLRIARRYQLYYIAETLADYRLHPFNRHRRLMSDPAYARTVLFILDQLFAEPDHQPAKQRLRGRAYGRAYVRFADSCFGEGRMADARSYYLRAARHNPRYLLQPSFLRHCLGTWLGARCYSALKLQ